MKSCKIGTVELHHCDCLELLKTLPDKSFDLLIADPPYRLTWKSRSWKFKFGNTLRPDEVAKVKQWDSIPSSDWFEEVKRVTKNQIIWGGNYMLEHLGSCRGPIIWNKGRREFTLADGELAWSSLKHPLRIIDCGPSISQLDKKDRGGRWHPHTKPVFLYKRVLEMYAKPGWKLLDTHLGSGTLAMACLDAGFDLIACEIDEEYYEAAVARIRDYFASCKNNFFDKNECSVKKLF